VTFNDHEGSTKSYSYVKDHDEPLADVSFVPYFEDIAVDYDPGSTMNITCPTARVSCCARSKNLTNPTNKTEACAC